MNDIDLIKREEGCRLTAYKDTEGLWTIGWGHLLPKGPDWSGLTWTQAMADGQLELDIVEARNDAASLPGFQRCNDVRKAVLVSMCYQLGSLYGWPKFKAALALGDFDIAAEEGMDSLWAKQTPARAQRQMHYLRTGAMA